VPDGLRPPKPSRSDGSGAIQPPHNARAQTTAAGVPNHRFGDGVQQPKAPTSFRLPGPPSKAPLPRPCAPRPVSGWAPVATGARVRPFVSGDAGVGGCAAVLARFAAGAPLSPDLHDKAEHGIRTRDPHLGKVAEFVRMRLAGPPKCGSVHPVSSPSTQPAAVVERSALTRILRARCSSLKSAQQSHLDRDGAIGGLG
jgi:hypothetical protein